MGTKTGTNIAFLLMGVIIARGLYKQFDVDQSDFAQQRGEGMETLTLDYQNPARLV
jgi:hypothetical protein